MMFTTLKSRLAGTKAKVAAGAAIAATAMLMAVPAAQAQRVRFGVTIGAPVYVAPAPVYVAPAPVYVAPAPVYPAPAYAYAAPAAEVVFTGPGYYDGIYFRDYNAWHAHYLSMHGFDRRAYDRHVDARFGRR